MKKYVQLIIKKDNEQVKSKIYNVGIVGNEAWISLFTMLIKHGFDVEVRQF